MEAHTLSLNNFGMPQVYTGTDSAYVHIIYLLLLEPGKYQSHPNMGVGIRSRYRYNNDENFLTDLANDITQQINSFLPELADVQVSLTRKDHVLGIIINTTTGNYTVSYDSVTDTIDAPAVYILDQL